MAVVDCPFCRTKVVPRADRTCPACGRAIAGAPATADGAPAPPGTPPAQIAVPKAVLEKAASLVKAGKPRTSVEAELKSGGLQEADAALVAEELLRLRAEALKETGGKNLVFGALWCVGGLLVTAFTYAAAGPGGTYVIAWGAVVFGGAQCIQGWIQLSKAGRIPS